MKSSVLFLSSAALVVSAGVLVGAGWLWRDAQAARREMAAAVALLSKSASSEKTAGKLAGPPEESGWDFSGTSLSDEAWKLSQEDAFSSGLIPAVLTEPARIPGLLSSGPEGYEKHEKPLFAAPVTDPFKAARNRAAYLPEAAESPVLHRGDLQNVRPATLVDPQPAPAAPGSE